MHRSARPELIRRINRTLILDLLVERGPLSRAALAAETGLSAPATSRAVADLLAEGLVMELGAGNSSGGRRPILLAFNPMAGAMLVLDIRPHRIIAVATALDGRPFARTEVPTTQRGPELLAEVLAVARGLRESITRPLRGVGATLSGVCVSGVVTQAPALGWEGVRLGDALQAAFGVPVYVENDVNALVLGEQWRGALVGCQQAVGVVVGTGGIGAGLLVGGQLYRGRDGAAGEIGSWWLGPDGPDGNLEDHASVTAWARQWAGTPGHAAHRPPLDDFLRALAAREPAALAVLNRVADLLGAAVANLVTAFNPELVVLGGEALMVADLLIPSLEATVRARSPYPAAVVPARLGEQGAHLGLVRGLWEQDRRSVSFVG